MKMETIIFLGTLFVLVASVASTPSLRSQYEPSSLCSSPGHHLIPHEHDCAKFYYCSYGLKEKAPRVCPPGTLFSYDFQVCDYASSVNCQLAGTTTAREEPTTETTTPENHRSTYPPTYLYNTTTPHITTDANGTISWETDGTPGPEISSTSLREWTTSDPVTYIYWN